MYFYNSLFYEDETFLAEESAIETYTNKVTGYYGYLNNTLTLSKDGSFTGDLSLTYISPFIYGVFKVDETMKLNIGLRKSLWDNRAIISIVAEDLLRRTNYQFTTLYANQDISLYEARERQFIRFGFTYNLGNYRLSNTERNTKKSELQRLDN